MVRMLAALCLTLCLPCTNAVRSAAQAQAADPQPVTEEAVPEGAWSTPFAFPVAEVLSAPLDQVQAALSAQERVTLTDLRAVAVTADRTAYVAGESPFRDSYEWAPRVETRIWTSTDRGATWSLLLTSRPGLFCSYDARLHAAALHPDGERVVLALTEGIYVDGRDLASPRRALRPSADPRRRPCPRLPRCSLPTPTRSTRARQSPT
ncbi:MAG: hypothetical protein AB1505_22420 [Candidatus Latescibacterota bacterium]